MNVTVENLGPCKRLLRFEVAADAVEKGFAAVAADFQRQARLPGFRPGKAPLERVIKAYEKEIADEVKRKLIGETYREGIKEQKLNVLNLLDVEEIQFARGQALQFAATVELTPEFELPEYRGLPARRERAVVTDEDVARAIDVLRGQRATFQTVAREVRPGDFVVVNFTGTCDGKPITDTAPTARGLTEQKGFWIEVKPDSFIPGFAEQLIGAKAGEQRSVSVDFPADFVTPQLAGKRGSYQVEVLEVKERVLPELNEEFAKSFGAETLERLREGVRSDLQNEVNLRQKRSVRSQILAALLNRVQFDLPESTVEQETRNVVYEIVSENQKRGVSRELIEQQKDEIYSAANMTAKDRVKIGFLFHRIAEKEGIRASDQEMNARIVMLANAYQMSPQKFIKELQKRNGLGEIYQQIVHEKVTAFLQENAHIEDVDPAPGAPQR
ncbi:MAG TPA: trigger factor [Methylomirabilota bacterium]|nr:trigger factor [Methylomirabilota bacterium]